MANEDSQFELDMDRLEYFRELREDARRVDHDPDWMVDWLKNHAPAHVRDKHLIQTTVT